MSFGEAISSGFRRYTDFGGRSSRAELGFWTLFVAAGTLGFGILDSLINTGGALAVVFLLVALTPGLAVATRRLHDINRSGWWLLLLATLIGIVVLVIWWTKDGHEGLNRYGRNPLTV
jgi:uncharacterized membrane protein YhaH (DUF805 family)